MLRDALAETAAGASATDSFEADGADKQADAEAKPVGVLVRVTPAIRRELRLISVRRGTTVQSLLLAAIMKVLQEPDSGRPKL